MVEKMSIPRSTRVRVIFLHSASIVHGVINVKPLSHQFEAVLGFFTVVSEIFYLEHYTLLFYKC